MRSLAGETIKCISHGCSLGFLIPPRRLFNRNYACRDRCARFIYPFKFFYTIGGVRYCSVSTDRRATAIFSSPNPAEKSDSTPDPRMHSHTLTLQIVAFCMVGALGFATEFILVCTVKHHAPELLLYARFFSFPPALAVTYVLNRLFVFRSRERVIREAALYTTGQIAGALLNLALYMTLIALLPAIFLRLPELALAAGSTLGLIWNFSWSKILVFRSPHRSTVSRLPSPP